MPPPSTYLIAVRNFVLYVSMYSVPTYAYSPVIGLSFAVQQMSKKNFLIQYIFIIARKKTGKPWLFKLWESSLSIILSSTIVIKFVCIKRFN